MHSTWTAASWPFGTGHPLSKSCSKSPRVFAFGVFDLGRAGGLGLLPGKLRPRLRVKLRVKLRLSLKRHHALAHCYRLRPYHVEHTASRPICQVKQRWARLVLGWGTAWESRVLSAFFFPFRSSEA